MTILIQQLEKYNKNASLRFKIIKMHEKGTEMDRKLCKLRFHWD